MITFDYRCTNMKCTEFHIIAERLHKRDEVQTCPKCKDEMQRLACGPKQPHVSWSTWRAL